MTAIGLHMRYAAVRRRNPARGLVPLKIDKWTISHLHDHLQYAVDLEFWTVPFYMSALYSIVDRASDAFQFVQSVVNQEMLHVQLASNIANAYGLSPTFSPPIYAANKIPHLHFDQDPVARFSPYSAEISPMDTERTNAMCLIEYPEGSHDHRTFRQREGISNIGAFYAAVVRCRPVDGASAGRRQANRFFSAFYRNMPALTVQDSGQVGFSQVDRSFRRSPSRAKASRRRAGHRLLVSNAATDKARS